MRYAKRELRNNFMPLLARLQRQIDKQKSKATPKGEFNVLGFEEPEVKEISRFDLLNRRRGR